MDSLSTDSRSGLNGWERVAVNGLCQQKTLGSGLNGSSVNEFKERIERIGNE
jgi:hypothetical protein